MSVDIDEDKFIRNAIEHCGKREPVLSGVYGCKEKVVIESEEYGDLLNDCDGNCDYIDDLKKSLRECSIDNSNYLEVGEAVKDIRNKKRISLRKLEKLTGINDSNISRIENGKLDPRITTVNKIFNALKAHIEIKAD